MDQFQSQGSATTAPPPPTEVKIRTMKSDIAMLSTSGGAMPRFENVHVAGLAKVHAQEQESKQEVAASAGRTESKGNLLLIIVLIITLAALAVVGWLIYLKFKG